LYLIIRLFLFIFEESGGMEIDGHKGIKVKII
jgi:hypothetical protein